ncbi:MAG: J domain-containing protein [Leptonema sp. (in: bacteria)]
MDDIFLYCKILGVQPGDSSEKVKAAFREKIKECHPDKGGDVEKARSIIEAYEKLKDGVPIIGNNQNKKENQRISKEVFQDFLSRVFANDPHILNIINEILKSYGMEEIDFPTAKKRYYEEHQYHSYKGLEEFEKAEKYFHYSMDKFNSQKSRPIRYRSLELVKNLSQVQILYRTVMVKHPSFTLKCKKRLEQIQELMDHAKLTL